MVRIVRSIAIVLTLAFAAGCSVIDHPLHAPELSVDDIDALRFECESAPITYTDEFQCPEITLSERFVNTIQRASSFQDRRILPYLAMLLLRVHSSILDRYHMSVELDLAGNEWMRLFVRMEGVLPLRDSGYLSGTLANWICEEFDRTPYWRLAAEIKTIQLK